MIYKFVKKKNHDILNPCEKSNVFLLVNNGFIGIILSVNMSINN